MHERKKEEPVTSLNLRREKVGRFRGFFWSSKLKNIEKMVNSILSVPVMDTLCVHICILALKMLIMSPLVARQRIFKGIFANPEDVVLKFRGKGTVKIEEDVERIRRAHLNDLENIPVFIIICALYLLTNPSVYIATNLIRVYTIARILHTLVYAIVVVPQPARALAWGLGYFITLFMAIKTLIHFIVYV